MDNCVRFDATKNNIDQVLKFMRGEIDKMRIDEYDGTNTEQDLKKLLSMSNAIII